MKYLPCSKKMQYWKNLEDIEAEHASAMAPKLNKIAEEISEVKGDIETKKRQREDNKAYFDEVCLVLKG